MKKRKEKNKVHILQLVHKSLTVLKPQLTRIQENVQM